MGLFSNWFSGNTSASAAGTPGSPSGARDKSGSKPNVWRSVFNPGSNPAVENVGRDYYDHVDDKSKAPTTWEYILQSQDFKARTFSQIDQNKDGFIDKEDLRKVVGPNVDVGKLIKEADINNDGKIDRKEYARVMDKHFGTA